MDRGHSSSWQDGNTGCRLHPGSWWTLRQSCWWHGCHGGGRGRGRSWLGNTSWAWGGGPPPGMGVGWPGEQERQQQQQALSQAKLGARLLWDLGHRRRLQEQRRRERELYRQRFMPGAVPLPAGVPRQWVLLQQAEPATGRGIAAAGNALWGHR